MLLQALGAIDKLSPPVTQLLKMQLSRDTAFPARLHVRPEKTQIMLCIWCLINPLRKLAYSNI